MCQPLHRCRGEGEVCARHNLTVPHATANHYPPLPPATVQRLTSLRAQVSRIQRLPILTYRCSPNCNVLQRFPATFPPVAKSLGRMPDPGTHPIARDSEHLLTSTT